MCIYSIFTILIFYIDIYLHDDVVVPNIIKIIGKVAVSAGKNPCNVNVAHNKVHTKDVFTQTLNDDDWAFVDLSDTLAKPGCKFCHTPNCTTEPCTDLFEDAAAGTLEVDDDVMGKN